MPALYVIFGLVLIALIVLAVLWYFLKGNKANVAPAADANDPGGAGNEEIDSLVREAERRLGASKQGDRLGNLPIFFLAGDTGSTKTSIMVNAGLEPELLAGLVYRDNTLAMPMTRAAPATKRSTLWCARRSAVWAPPSRVIVSAICPFFFWPATPAEKKWANC